jgi:hypothetical protein
LAHCEGFRVQLDARPAAFVEEVWLGAARTPAALVVSLPGARRVVVTLDQIEAVDSERREIRLARGAAPVDLSVAR